jgi:hypothetical protein
VIHPERIHTLEPSNDGLPPVPVEGVSTDYAYMRTSNNLVVPIIWAVPKGESTPNRGTLLGLGHGANVHPQTITRVAITSALLGQRVIAPLTPLAADYEVAKAMHRKIDSQTIAAAYQEVLAQGVSGFSELDILDIIGYSKDAHMMTAMLEGMDDKEIATFHIIDPVNLFSIRSLSLHRNIGKEFRRALPYVRHSARFHVNRFTRAGKNSLPKSGELEEREPEGMVALRPDKSDLQGFGPLLIERLRESAQQGKKIQLGLWYAVESSVSKHAHVRQLVNDLKEQDTDNTEVEVIRVESPTDGLAEDDPRRPRHAFLQSYHWLESVVRDIAKRRN